MKIPEARNWMAKGEHTRLYTFGPDFLTLPAVWNGSAHWADGGTLEVVDGIPKGGPVADATATPYQFAPQYDPTEIYSIAQSLMKKL
jgi:hypothetical protein